MAYYLGIDTSNYTTSAALFDSCSNKVTQSKKLLPVKDGALGLRQSDAVFSHIKQLGPLLVELLAETPNIEAVGVSVRPRDIEGSYMPCFLVGELAAQTAALAAGKPVWRFSHQAGHIAAALFSAGQPSLYERNFAAFHFSGGTTECLLVSPGSGQPFSIDIFAQSLDLKAGQAIDRVGGMLGLPFPAGKALEELALQSKECFSPKPSFQGNNCSLSGIENRCRQLLERGQAPCNVARFCIDSVLAVVCRMTELLRERHGELPVVYAGGVLSNSMIREAVTARYGGYFAEPVFSADNAAGVAILASQMGKNA